MSWASRRRTVYISSILLFFGLVIVVPLAYWYFSIPATCHDGIQNQGETAPDRGGPCLMLDAASLQPEGILWARSFRVRDGSYNALALIQNPNQDAGVVAAQYHVGLYDQDNALIAERDGTTFIMPGGITPIFEPHIDTGNRIVAHTYFNFTQQLHWERVSDSSSAIVISNKTPPTAVDLSSPRISAQVQNTSVSDIVNPGFVAVVYDTAGNALNASATTLDRLAAGSSAQISFVWPESFAMQVGRIDITALVPPQAIRGLQ